ncbi:MAG: KH domain-containing protein, partial [Clostridia bacterium]|nr:KH domain-containing protein [Clostridia bacterium]
PVKKEAQASGILDSMPAYRITESEKKTPVYRETGANVKTYARSPMQTAAVADGSIYSENTPVADVRWDSARDLKKAEEAAAAAMAAAAPKAVDPIKASEMPAPAAGEAEKRTEARPMAEPAAEEYIPSDGSIDVAALDAAIEAMVEDLPAPESRKKTGITAAEMEHALAFVTTLLANMQIDAKAVALPCPEGEEYEITGDANIYPAMEIAGNGTGILIGHHGETLDAIQYLLNLAAIRHSDNPNGDYVKISLDIENYRAKREETLRSLARRMAQRALKYKRNVFLEPMNAYERRIIHSELQSVANVSTHSVGTDKNRKIIITYEGPDKVYDRRSRENPGEKPEGGRKDHGRGRKRHDRPELPAESADLTAEPAEGPAKYGEEAVSDLQTGEHRSRSRNRNRNRNRRRRSEGELSADGMAEGAADASVKESPAVGGAAAIISGEEREQLDRQLSDPTNRSEKKPQPRPVEDIPEFLRQPTVEPAEHLREN